MIKRQLVAISVVICFMLFCSTTSCVVITKKDNGKHKGWYKHPNNPHYKNSHSQPHHDNGGEKSKGKQKGKSQGKSKGKSK